MLKKETIKIKIKKPKRDPKSGLGLLTLKLPAGGALPLGILAYGSQVKKSVFGNACQFSSKKRQKKTFFSKFSIFKK